MFSRLESPRLCLAERLLQGAPSFSTFSRGFALFSGLFLAWSAMQIVLGREGLHHWVIYLHGIEQWPLAVLVVLAVGAVSLCAIALHPNMTRNRARVCSAVTFSLALMSAGNCLQYLELRHANRIASPVPVPLSIFAVASFLLVSANAFFMFGSRVPSRKNMWKVAGLAGAVAAIFPLLQMFFFGTTDYRRPAEAIVVFGARTYANGRLSDALADRVRTAAELYRSGLASTVIMSGGPGDGAIHETEAMQRYAVSLGVPKERILLDDHGLNTRATIQFLETLRAKGFNSFLAVSHGYHLPRVKLTAQKAGINVYTVGAASPRVLAKLPYFMLRETAAWWAYLAS